MFVPRDSNLPSRPDVLYWLLVAYRWAAYYGLSRTMTIDGDLMLAPSAMTHHARWRLRRTLAQEIPLPHGYDDPWRDDPEPAAETFDVSPETEPAHEPLPLSVERVLFILGITLGIIALASPF